MINRKQKGSITIFAVLALVLVAECLFILLEGARFWEINRSAGLQSELAMESVFAEYCSPLWEEYCLLGRDASDMESALITYANGRTSAWEWRENLLNFELGELEIEGYTRITDGNGAAFRNAVSNYMRDNILYESAKLIYSHYEAISSILGSDTSDMENIDEALESLEEEQEEAVTKAARGGVVLQEESDTEEATEVQETSANPLEVAKELQETGILHLLVEDPEDLSAKTFDSSQAVSKRELSGGKNYEIQESEWIDRILLQQYLLSYLSSYGNEKENRALSYEIEYLIVGQESDIENLKTIAERLLLIRQAANMLYLLSDSVKVEEATVLATLLAGATANPVVIELVKAALLTAWAFGESVLDVRGLLQGKRIPLLKSEELWTLQLSGIGELVDGYATAKESEVGLSYTDYLGILLLFEADSTTALRAMDMQEQTVRLRSGYADFAMDNLMIRANVTMTYEYQPVFQMFDTISGGLGWDYEIKKTVSYQY